MTSLFSLKSRFRNKSFKEAPLLQSCKQSSRLSPQQPPAQDEDPNGGATSKKHRVTIGIGGIAAKVILVFHLLTAFAAIAAEAAASASSHSQSQSPFRFRFADNYGGSGHGGGGSGGFRWKRFPEVAPTAANNADLLVRKLMKRSTFDDLDCRGMYDQVSEQYSRKKVRDTQSDKWFILWCAEPLFHRYLR